MIAALYPSGRDNYLLGRHRIVISWARRQDDGFTTDDLMAAHSVNRDNAHQILSRLVRARMLVRTGRGTYRVRR